MCTFKEFLLSALFVAIFSTYNLTLAETNDKDSHHQAQHSLDWPGLYHGFTPCADCMGVKTTLALNTNNTYVLITQNVGKSIREFVEKGKFTWGDKSNMIILTPRKSTETSYYLVGENTLTQLDGKGEHFTGKEAERYVLRRTDVTQSPKEHSTH
jgi:uncharacterized lipoprotein NlpE involved in copper resistance